MLSHLVVISAITFLTLIELISLEPRQTLDRVFYFRY
tara:strand:- start:802 stop:912 length:111 start_codon:yes stop_codon:yes gene_type:complete